MLFVQSHLHEHPEAAWLLGAVATTGELNRMTQFKDKGEGRDSVAAALFTYPVLMAADILLYKADRVPVGDDQRQHLELATGRRPALQLALRRHVGGARGGDPADRRTGHGPAGADRQDVDDRRHASGHGAGRRPTRGRRPQEVRSAVTDSGREVARGEGKEGIANLIEIMAVASDRTPEQVEDAYDGAGYGQFKADVADAVIEYLRPVRERYEELVRDPGQLSATLTAGAEQARAVSSVTLAAIKQTMGFVAE